MSIHCEDGQQLKMVIMTYIFEQSQSRTSSTLIFFLGVTSEEGQVLNCDTLIAPTEYQGTIDYQKCHSMSNFNTLGVELVSKQQEESP